MVVSLLAVPYPTFSYQTVPSTYSSSWLIRSRKSQDDPNSKNSSISSISNTTTTESVTEDTEKPYSITALIIPRVMIAAMNYASLSFIDICFKAVQPLFFSTPIHLGGLGLPPSTIGTILSCYGILNGVISIFLFAKIDERWGTKNVFIAGIVSAIPAFATFPVLNALAKSRGLCMIVWVGIAVQISLSVAWSLSYGKLTTSKLRFSEFFIIFGRAELLSSLCLIQAVCISTLLLHLRTEHLSAARMVSVNV